MKLVITISRSDYSDKNSWAFFAACKIAETAGIDHCCVYLVDTKIACAKDGWFKAFHYLLERKFSNINQDYSDYKISVPIVNVVKIGDDDIVCNLSGLSEKELRVSFPTQRIWSICYHNQPIQNYQHIGEYEIVERKAAIEISLVESVAGDSKVVDVAKYNPHYSAIRNLQNVVYSLHLLIAKNLKNYPQECNDVVEERYGGGKFGFYLLRFYVKVFGNIATTWITRVLPSLYPEHWTVGIARGNFLKDGLKNIFVHPLPHNEFWADPFLYRYPLNNKLYLFVERFPFREQKGLISCAEVNDKLQISKMVDILEKPYHLSYPHIIEEDETLYMMPECSANKKIEIGIGA